jgi:hypothetical protein
MSETAFDDSPARLTDHLSVGVLTKFVPRFVVDEVVAECGAGELRSRSLPAHVVVYFVMALALFRDGYGEVIRYLVHGLRFARTWSRSWSTPSTSALSQARRRLGENVMATLFWRVAVPVAKAGTPGAWAGRFRLFAVDSVWLDMPDTDENKEEFPKAGDDTLCPLPQAKVTAIGECGTHAVVAAVIGTTKDGEQQLAEELLDVLEPGMLLAADRGFFSFELWRKALATGADLVFRVKSDLHLPVLEVLEDGSYISEVHKPRPGKTRINADQVDNIMLATHIRVRVVEYTVETGSKTKDEVFRIITSVLDPGELNAMQIAAAYKERWEIELLFREVECQLRPSRSTLRSKTPTMIRQEIWGLLLTYYAVRAFMAEAADSIDIDPDRISPIRTINIIRRSITDRAEFSPLSPATKL